MASSPPITWRNVNAPSNAAAMQLLSRSGQQLGDAIGGLGDAVKTGAQDYADSQTADFLNDLNAERDPAARQQMIDASSAFLDNQQVNAAQTANRAEDRTAQTFANAQTTFGNQQTLYGQQQDDRLLKLADAETKRNRDKILAGHQDQDQVMQVQAHNEKLRQQWITDNAANVYLGKPSTPEPKYIEVGEVVPSPVQAAGTAINLEAARVAPEVPVTKDISNNNSRALALESPPQYSAKQKEHLDKGWITKEELDRNASINRSRNGTAQPLTVAEATTRLITSESGNRNIPNIGGKSTALGLGQVVDETWTSLAKKHPGITEEGRGDPLQQKRAVELLVAEYQSPKQLGKYGLQDDMSAVKASHFLGWGRAEKVIKALQGGKENTLASAILPANYVTSNPEMFEGDPTVKELWARLSNTVPDGVQPTTAAEARQKFLDNPATFTDSAYQTPPKFANPIDAVNAQTYHAAALMDAAHRAMVKAGYKEDGKYTPEELSKLFLASNKTISNKVPDDKVPAALKAFITSEGLDATTLDDPAAAKTATKELGYDTLKTSVSEAIQSGNITDLDVRAMVGKYGLDMGKAGKEIAPFLTGPLTKHIMDEMTKDRTAETNIKHPYGAFLGDTKVYEVTEAGVEFYNKLSEDLVHGKYSYLPVDERNGILDRVNALLSIESGDKANKEESAAKNEIGKAETLATNAVFLEKATFKAANGKLGLINAFPQVPPDELTHVMGFVHKNYKWPKGMPSDMQRALVRHAMTEVGHTDLDNFLGIETGDYETASSLASFTDQDDLDSKLDAKYKDIAEFLNENIGTKYNPNRKKLHWNEHTQKSVNINTSWN